MSRKSTCKTGFEASRTRCECFVHHLHRVVMLQVKFDTLKAVERAPRIGHYDSQVGRMRLSRVLSSPISSSRTSLVVRSLSMSSVRPHARAMGETLRSRSVDACFSYWGLLFVFSYKYLFSSHWMREGDEHVELS